MDLAEATGQFITATEGHTTLYSVSAATLEQIIKKATISEILEQYNILSAQKLWSEPLIDIYYNTILDRIHNEVSFSISTCWKDIEKWSKKPRAIIQATLEQNHYLLDCDGVPLQQDTKVKTDYLRTDDFAKDYNEDVLSMLALNDKITVAVEVLEDKLKVVGITETDNLKSPILYFYNNVKGLSKPLKNIRIIPADAYIIKEFDVNTLFRMLRGLRDNNPEVIDEQKELKRTASYLEKEEIEERHDEDEEYKIRSKL